MTLDEFLDTFKATPEADGYVAPCPGHDDSHASLRIAVGESRLLLKCRAGCDTPALLTAAGLTFADLPSGSALQGAITRAVSASAPASSAHVAALAVRLDAYEAALPAVQEALDYAADRFGIDAAHASLLGLGYADDLGGGPRVVVPFRDANGVARGFQARALDPAAKVRWLGPKSPQGESWSKVAFCHGTAGWDEVIVTEGPGDALTACGVGYDSIGVRGAALAQNTEVVEAIASYAAGRPVVVIGDADPAGEKFARDLAAALAKRGVSVRKIRPEMDGDDLSDWRAAAPAAFAVDLCRAVTNAVDPGGLVTRLDAWPAPAQTELAQARRLADRIEASGSGVRYTPEQGFFTLGEGVWSQDALDTVRTAAQDAAADVWTEADTLYDLAETAVREAEDEVENAPGIVQAAAAKTRLAEAKKRLRHARELRGFARQANSSRGLDAVVKELRALSGVAASLLDFDNHHHLLACRNGVVDLRTGDLIDHDPALLLSKRIDVDYDPAARAPRWERFLEEVFPAYPDLPAYMKRLVGYGITGMTSAQCFAVHYGTGANGKSVFLDTLTQVFRPITETTPFSTFEIKPSGGIPNDLAALRGARLVMASEGEQGRPMAESVLKRVTGHDEVAARFMRAEFFSFRPTFLLNLASNFKPAFKGQDDGLWRRVKLIPWDRYFAPSERDYGLGEALLKEKAGIFTWAVQGATEWYAHGLQDPPVISGGTTEYRATSDALAGFLGTDDDPGVFIKETGAVTTLAVLWQGYGDWHDEEGLPAKDRWSRKAFAGAMEERGLVKRKRATGIVFEGVRKARRTDVVKNHDVHEDDVETDEPAAPILRSEGPSLDDVL